MNIFPFLASNAEAVGAPAISWDAPGIIFLKLLAVVFLVLLNGFFVAIEFAIVKVRASQLDALAAPSNGRARLARHITTHLDAYLSATLCADHFDCTIGLVHIKDILAQLDKPEPRCSVNCQMSLTWGAGSLSA
jgi:CBS domain containing-hemolysin-like protein